MTTRAEPPRGGASRKDYRHLPPGVTPDEVIASVEPDPVPDPEADRNADQHRALRDD